MRVSVLAFASAIDGDRGVPDRYQLIAHLRERHPSIVRLLLVTNPWAVEVEDYDVVDKRRDALTTVVARIHDARTA